MAMAYTLYNHPKLFFIGLTIVMIWTLVWKGIGLWYAGKHRQKVWFIAMLVLNTAGLLPIIYLVWFKPREKDADTRWQRKQQRNKASKASVRINSASVKFKPSSHSRHNSKNE